LTDRPQIGLLGIMQELYDDMLPGITDRQGANALVRSGLPFSVLTGYWRSHTCATGFGDWAR
jgi:hypothetical protein